MEFRRVAIIGPPEPKAFGEVLKGLLKRKRFYEKGRYGALSHAWERVIGEVLGDEVAAQTCVTAYRHGLVTVDVACPVLLQEMGGFLRAKLLERLQSVPGGEDVGDLRFRMGRGSAP